VNEDLSRQLARVALEKWTEMQFLSLKVFSYRLLWKKRQPTTW
jgi:hypothetical protein